MFAIASHDPAKLYKRNRGVLSMSNKQLGDFARTARKGLPKKVSVGQMMTHG